MALATKCPHCNTIFRVAADQLKLRGGIVRCGSCHEVFDGNAALVEPAPKPTPVIPDTAAEAAAPAPAVPAVSEYVHGSPVDFEIDLVPEPAPAAPQPRAAEPAQAAPPPAAPAPAVWRNAPAPSPAPSPDDVALAAVARAFATVVAPPAVAPEPAQAPAAPVIDDKLLTWEDLPENESARIDAAAMAAAARAAEPAPTPAEEAPAPAPIPAPAPAPAPAIPTVIVPEPEPEPELEPEPEPEPESEFEPEPDHPGPPLEDETPPPQDVQPDLDAGAALVEAIEQWPVDNTHPDGRIEPMLDTPQEHLVLAALDDAHHFEDLPPALAEPEPVAHEVGAVAATSLTEEPWPAALAGAEELAPTGEPWSLSEPEHDETALHAVAAVNTDAPDDGASLSDEAPAAEPRLSRRERALQRAQARLEARAAEEAEQARELELQADASAADEAAAAAARMRAIAGVDEAEDLDHSDLSFVKRVERSQKYGKAIAIAMAVGIPLLLAGLALQAATTFRDTLAANYPQLKPVLAAVCEPLGCKIALPTQLDALSVEQGELATMAEGTFSFSTVLRNQSRTVQAWPHLELTLNDNADKPVLRRVFAPGEYLPSPADAEKGFAPHSEQSVKLYFELKQLKASGYHIAIFYP